MGDRLGPYRAKRDFDATPEPAPAEAAGEDARALRRAGASRSRAALGPAARARGHARLLGRPEGHPARPRAQPPGGAHRGPSARVPRVPRRHPGGRVRRGHHADLGPRHVRVAQVAGGRGDGHLPRRAPGGQVRPVPHGRQELDDPPDGSAAGRGSRADAQAPGADAGAGRRPPARGRRLGLRGQVGRRARDRLRRGRPAEAPQPQLQRHHARATPSCASSGARSARARPCSTARWSPSGPTASRASRSSRAGCTWSPTPRSAGSRPRTPSPM